MPQPGIPTIENTVEIDAPPARVWELVSDLRNAPRWSSQAWKVLPVGATRIGTRALNVNKQGGWVWPTTSKVVDYVPGRRIANRIDQNFTVWAFELEPTAGGGTRLTERRETPDGVSSFSNRLADMFFGGEQKFGGVLTDGVSTSLERIKALAERG